MAVHWGAAAILTFTSANLVASSCFAQSASEQRDFAVQKARAGDRVGGEAMLRAMLAAGVDDGRVAFDLTALLEEDGKARESVEVFARARQTEAPEYALLAAARAYRSLGRWGDAERFASDGQSRFPNNPTWPLLLSLVLSDAGRGAEALQIVQGPSAARAPAIERLMAQAYAHRRSGQPFTALREYAEAGRLAPNNAEVRREMADLMSELGGPFGASRMAPTTPSIAASQAAAMVRWGERVKPRDPARRFDGTDAAIARLEALLRSTQEPAIRRRLRQDHVIALRDRFRMEEVVQEAEALKANAPLPAYVDEAYADALLYLRRPGPAREGYERVLARDSKNVQARYGQFYASVELEDFKTAYAAIDALDRDEPIWRFELGDPTRYPNLERPGIEIAAAKGRLYADQLGEAWDRVSILRDAAPASADIRLTAHQVASARGWPRLAQQEAEIASSLAPEELGERLGLVDVAIQNFEYAEADRRMAELVALYPEDRNVPRTARTLAAQHRWLLEAEGKFDNTSGGGANAAGQEMESTARLYTPPIADHWRLFALNNYSFAHPLEGFVSRDQLGAGVDWRSSWLRASLFADQSFGTLGRFGGGGTVDVSINDQISVGASAEFFSADTPLRAQFYGITSDEYALRAAYRWHESRNLTLTGAYQPFSDGNQRLSATGSFKEKFLAMPGFALTGLIDVGTSSNTLTNVQYYSPARDFTATGGLLAEHVLWKRYDTSLVQALQVEAGLYAEQGFANDWVGVASYEHRWRFDPFTELHYGVELSRRVYDGQELRGLAFVVGLRQRL